MKKYWALICLTTAISFSQENKEWVLSTNNPIDYYAPTMANGMIGIKASKTPMKVEQIVLNGVFDKFGNDNVQCILPGINFANIEVKTKESSSGNLDHIKNWNQELNIKEACLTTRFRLGDELKLTHRMYSLRHLPFSAFFDVEIEALKDVEIKISDIHKIEFPLKHTESQFKIFKRDHVSIPLLSSDAYSPQNKHLISASSGFVFEEKPPKVLNTKSTEEKIEQYFTIRLKKGEIFKFSLVGSVVSTADFQDPHTEAQRQCIFAMLEGKDKLIENHIKAWQDLWQSDIIIEGDPVSQKDIRFALFNLYSSIREDSNYSIPPMGLTSIEYYGHIFWDSELWMFPPLLVLNTKLSKPILDYRIKHIESARIKATSYGYKGVMFPWESDDKGEESTPAWALSGPFEHHVTAGVGIALWNYFQVTQDKNWLKDEAFPILKDIASFWISRSTKDLQGNYHINNVVGADEYAENVDDNAFTNGAAKTIMEYTINAARVLDEPIDSAWVDFEKRVIIERFDNGVIKDFKGYVGQTIKQADVNLLSYPLKIVKDKESMFKNLSYYQEKLDPSGPAMTNSVYSIIYSKLGMKDKAWELFQKAYKTNQRPPYGVLSEGAFDNNPYFMTAAGGLLQTVLYGFCGVEITNTGIQLKDPKLPTQWKSVTLKGIGLKKETINISN